VQEPGKKNTSIELLWSYYLLKLLRSSCSPAEPGAQHPRMDLLGENCVSLPRCAHSQMGAWLHHCHTARRSSSSSATPHNQSNAGTSMPGATFRQQPHTTKIMLGRLCHMHSTCVIPGGLRNTEKCNKPCQGRGKGSRFDTRHETTVKWITRSSRKAGICG